MNWILDIVLAVFILAIIIIFTKRGCKTVFSLLTPIVTFICSYFFGKPLGNFILGNTLNGSITGAVEKLLGNIIPAEGITVGDLRENGTFNNIINTTLGEKADFAKIFNGVEIVKPENIPSLAKAIAQPVANMLAQIIGCICVFIIVRVAMFIISKIFASVVKLPVLKQMDGILGFVIGVISAFAYTWIISLALSFIIRYNFIGDEINTTLQTLAHDSIIMNFFCNLSLVDIVNLVK